MKYGLKRASVNISYNWRPPKYFQLPDDPDQDINEDLLNSNNAPAMRIGRIFENHNVSKVEKDKKKLYKKCKRAIRFEIYKRKFVVKKFDCLVKLEREKYEYEAMVYVCKKLKMEGFNVGIGYDWDFNWIWIREKN